MSVTASIVMNATVVETLTTNADSLSGGDTDITHKAFNFNSTIKSDSLVPATKVSAQVVALSTGAKTLDLTALTGANGGTVDATGLKLQVWKVKNLGAADMTFTFGAANPYNALGSAFLFVLKQNQQAMFFLNDSSPDVGSGAKTIDVSGTGSQTFQNLMIFG